MSVHTAPAPDNTGAPAPVPPTPDPERDVVRVWAVVANAADHCDAFLAWLADIKDRNSKSRPAWADDVFADLHRLPHLLRNVADVLDSCIDLDALAEADRRRKLVPRPAGRRVHVTVLADVLLDLDHCRDVCLAFGSRYDGTPDGSDPVGQAGRLAGDLLDVAAVIRLAIRVGRDELTRQQWRDAWDRLVTRFAAGGMEVTES